MHNLSRLGILVAVALASVACKRREEAPDPTPSVPGRTANDRPSLELRVAYGSEKKTWLEQQIAAFHAIAPVTKDGRPIRVVGQPMGSGEAVQGILGGQLQPHVFSP